MRPRHSDRGSRFHRELHKNDRVGWLRAAVLGANDGILSTAGLMIGVASADVARGSVLLAGVAGLVAGALSMAAGEYVSVSSQADVERAERELEAHELATDAVGEREELVNIYVARGLDRSLAEQVADKLTAHDALGAHLRDELGLGREIQAKPLEAALTSALGFALGALLPLLSLVAAPITHLVASVAVVSLLALMVLGAVAAQLGGAPRGSGAMRVLFWGALAMLTTAGIGALFGTKV